MGNKIPYSYFSGGDMEKGRSISKYIWKFYFLMKDHQWFPKDDEKLRRGRVWEESSAPAWLPAPLLHSSPFSRSHLTFCWTLGKFLRRALQLEGFKEPEPTPQAQGFNFNPLFGMTALTPSSVCQRAKSLNPLGWIDNLLFSRCFEDLIKNFGGALRNSSGVHGQLVSLISPSQWRWLMLKIPTPLLMD